MGSKQQSNRVQELYAGKKAQGFFIRSFIGRLRAFLSNEMPALSLSPQGSQLLESSCLTAVNQTMTLKPVVGTRPV